MDVDEDLLQRLELLSHWIDANACSTNAFTMGESFRDYSIESQPQNAEFCR